MKLAVNTAEAPHTDHDMALERGWTLLAHSISLLRSHEIFLKLAATCEIRQGCRWARARPNLLARAGARLGNHDAEGAHVGLVPRIER